MEVGDYGEAYIAIPTVTFFPWKNGFHPFLHSKSLEQYVNII